MIKNIVKYLKEEERQRKDYLSKLTYRRSVLIMEKFLSSKLALELNFNDDDHPISLTKLAQRT